MVILSQILFLNCLNIHTCYFLTIFCFYNVVSIPLSFPRLTSPVPLSLTYPWFSSPFIILLQKVHAALALGNRGLGMILQIWSQQFHQCLVEWPWGQREDHVLLLVNFSGLLRPDRTQFYYKCPNCRNFIWLFSITIKIQTTLKCLKSNCAFWNLSLTVGFFLFVS